MSKQSSHHGQPADDDQPTDEAHPTVPQESAADPGAPTEPIRPAEPVATPRRQRRRVDPEGETLHTGSTAKSASANDDRRPPIDDIIGSSPATAASAEPTVGAAPTTPLPTEPLEDRFEDAAAARARARERAVVGSPVTAVVLQVILAILAPLVILIAIIRLVASPVFLWFEYHRPGFPADQFGMDTEQRMTLGSYGLDYLFNLAPPAYLGNLRFDNGNPVFTEAEVSHMVDVKQVMMGTMIGGLIAAVLCIIIMVLLYRMRKGAIARSLFAGAVWFTIAMLIIAVVALVGWEAFFTGFHQMFFADGTWTFLTTDSLIRLYPGQFWMDAAIWVVGLTLLVMVIILVVTAPTGRRRYRNEQAQRFMESQVMGESNAPKLPRNG
jgi:integral membrane protein (TIGR01906 family)